MVSEPHVDALVCRPDPERRLDHVCDEQAEQDGEAGNQREAAEHHDGESDGRMQRTEPTGEPGRDAAVARLEDGHRPAIAVAYAA